MNRTVWVKAEFARTFEEKYVSVPTEEKGVFGGKKTRLERQTVETGISDCRIDGERLRSDMQIAIERLNSDGYEVVSVVPLESGRRKKGTVYTGVGDSSGFGYGFSFTEGIVIVARRFR